MKSNQDTRSKYNEHFERIKAPPERVAKTIMNSPPKKRDEWKYLDKLEKRMIN